MTLGNTVSFLGTSFPSASWVSVRKPSSPRGHLLSSVTGLPPLTCHAALFVSFVDTL